MKINNFRLNSFPLEGYTRVLFSCGNVTIIILCSNKKCPVGPDYPQEVPIILKKVLLSQKSPYGLKKSLNFYLKQKKNSELN